MKYIKIGVFGAKDFENAVKICVHLSRARARAKKLQKYVQNTCCISIYMFLGPRISKVQPKLSYTCPGPVHMQKNCKMCAKYMLYIDLYVFGAKNFKNVTKTFIHLPRAHAHANKLQKCVQNTCNISIYMFLEPRISKMQPKILHN